MNFWFMNTAEMSGIIKRLPAGFYVGQEVIGASGEGFICCLITTSCVFVKLLSLCSRPAFNVLLDRASF